MSETALAVVRGGDIISTQEMKAALQAAKEQQDLLGKFVKEMMTEGIDYGTIPGTERTNKETGKKEPNLTLLKPGAEKLIAFFRCHPEFDILSEREDLEKGVYAYKFRCKILSASGDVVAEGFGSGSSLESKHRWRTAQRTCPKCGQPAIRTSKQEPGYYCWVKIGGCGAKFDEGNKTIEQQQLGRVENPDAADVQNSVLKMAKKRSMVDAALALARCSDMFGQDLEDQEEAPRPQQQRQAPPKPTAQPTKAATVETVVNPETGEVVPLNGAPTLFEQLEFRIGESETLQQLAALAPECKAFPEAEQAVLRDLYRKRQTQLKAAPPEPGSNG